MGAGIVAEKEKAVREAISLLATDRSLPRTATKLAQVAGVGRATLYRVFEARPELRDSFDKLIEQSPSAERSKLERDLAERLGEIHMLKERLAALISTVEHLVRENKALRTSVTQHQGQVAAITKPGTARRANEPADSTE